MLDLMAVHAKDDDARAGADDEVDRLQQLHHVLGLAAVEVIDEDDEAGRGRGAQRRGHFVQSGAELAAKTELVAEVAQPGPARQVGQQGRRVGREGDQLGAQKPSHPRHDDRRQRTAEMRQPFQPIVDIGELPAGEPVVQARQRAAPVVAEADIDGEQGHTRQRQQDRAG